MATISTVLCEASPRVQRLREATLARSEAWTHPQEQELLAARAWWNSAWESSHIIRRGRLAGEILRGLTPEIADGELLVGRFCHRPLTPEEAEELANWSKYGFPAASRDNGQRAHMAIDYPRLLRQGITGVRAQIAVYRGRLDLANPDDLAKDDFYRACLEALDGVVALSHKYADLAEAQAETADPTRAEELREIARICRRVPEYPAETFREAIQAAHFMTFCQAAGNRMLLMQLGRPDRYLLPYYRRDLAAGRLTVEEAQELIDCMGLLLNDYTPRGLAVGYMVGGRDEYGVDATNELTDLCLRSLGHIRLAYPGIGLCWHRDMPAETLALASALLARGYSHPALFNDEVITDGLLRWGLSHRDACQYIHSTCVEITPVGISNVYVASPYYNLVQLLHDVLGIPPLESGDIGQLPDITEFDDLLTRYRTRLHEAVREGVIDINRAMASRITGGGFPLLSCFVNDCLAQGRDIDHGGARCNWIESSFVGLANLVDALAAIRQCVFDDRSVMLPRLREALLTDFQGYEDVRALLARAPKYGNDDDRVDLLTGEITRALLAECDAYRSVLGGAVVPGFFCWIVHEHYGRLTRASADGRAAGFPFADGSGPAQGRERFGPTAAVCSATKWDHAPMLGGIAVNLRFTPTRDPDELAVPLAQTLATFLRLGGFEAQVNVVSAATLRDAQAHPERYRDLVVRVAGYSDYFIHLAPNMQAEVMARSEMGL